MRNLGIGDAWDVLSGIRCSCNRVSSIAIASAAWAGARAATSPFLTPPLDRFKAISVGAGISDWMTYYVNTDIHPVHASIPEGDAVGRPEDLRRHLADDLYQAGAHADADPARQDDARVPIPNAFQLYQGLRDQNVPVQLSIFNGFGHGL